MSSRYCLPYETELNVSTVIQVKLVKKNTILTAMTRVSFHCFVVVFVQRGDVSEE